MYFLLSHEKEILEIADKRWERPKGTTMFEFFDMDYKKILDIVNGHISILFENQIHIGSIGSVTNSHTKLDDYPVLLDNEGKIIFEGNEQVNGFGILFRPRLKDHILREKEPFIKELYTISPILSHYLDDEIVNCSPGNVAYIIYYVIVSIYSSYKFYTQYLNESLNDEIIASSDFFMYLCRSRYFCMPQTVREKTAAESNLGLRNSLEEYKRIYLIDKPAKKEFESYICYNFNDIFCATIYNTLLCGMQFKKCNNCGKFFIPFSRSDTIYCDRKSPQDASLTCKEYGSQRLWYQKLRENEAASLCRNVYSAKQMLVKRNPDIEEYRNSFEKFKSLSKQWKADVKTGVKTEAEFIEWLKSVKEKKVL